MGSEHKRSNEELLWNLSPQEVQILPQDFFDQLNTAMCYSNIIYKNIDFTKCISTKEFKLAVAQKLIGDFTSRKRDSVPSTKRIRSFEGSSTAQHLPIVMATRGRCHVCSSKANDIRSFFKCSTCDVYLCILTTRNCFTVHHTVWFFLL